MKRLLALAFSAIFVVACSQTPVSNAARLVGAHDLVLVGDRIFVTSTDRDELRVLDLAPPGLTAGFRQYMRAPNPIEPLSVPVIARPSALTRDVHYVDLTDLAGGVIPLGQEIAGPWVYASRSGGSEISVVAAARDQLFELKLGDTAHTPFRIPTSEAVTAFAAWSFAGPLCAPLTPQCAPGLTCSEGTCIPPTGSGPPCKTTNDCGSGLFCAESACVSASNASRLYYATSDGEQATLSSFDLPGTIKGVVALMPTELTARQHPLFSFSGEVIVDMLVVPGLSGRGFCEDPLRQCLILATRSQQGREGRVLLFDPEKLSARELHFPAPVRNLAIYAGANGPTGYLAPGREVWGILREEKCGSPGCSGLIAVDTITGEVAIQQSLTTQSCPAGADGGLDPSTCPPRTECGGVDGGSRVCDYSGPMLPIVVGGTLPTGLALAAGGQLLLPPPLSGSVDTSLISSLSILGVTATSNGSLLFFDAARKTQIDTDPLGPVATTVVTLRPDGTQQPTCYADDHVTCELKLDGGACASSAEDCYLAGPLIDQMTFADGAWQSQNIDVVNNGLIPGLVGVVPTTSAVTDFNTGFAIRARVGDTLISTDPNSTCRTPIVALDSSSFSVAPQADCVGQATFAVRAGPTLPYVITGSTSGYLGRSGPGEAPFTAQTPYLERFADYDPYRPTVVLPFAPSPSPLYEDLTWEITIDSHFGPFAASIDPTGIGCLTALASSVVFDLDRQRVFTAYPSANGIVEFNPTNAVRGLTSLNAVCYP